MQKIGFGGGCHWCTEAVFQSLKGINKVAQGWIASTGNNNNYSEGVIVYFDEELIGLASLIEIHLHTHSCTSDHSMRHKYRSAVYCFSGEQETSVAEMIERLQPDFEKPIITKAMPFVSFKMNTSSFLDYYYSNPEKPFCTAFIQPKLTLLMKQFARHYNPKK